MSRLRVAFFGTSGPLSVGALEAIADGHTVAAVIQPVARRTPGSRLRRVLGSTARLAGLTRPGSIGALRRRHRFPVWEARSAGDPEIAARLDSLRADIICLAGFPWILPAATLAQAPLGAINLHAALLPRHRGPLPLFWIYYHDDRDSGVTVHRAVAEADAGEILGQASFPLERGFPVEQLNRRNGKEGAGLLQTVLGELAAGKVVGQPQDERLVTLAPMVRPGAAMVDFAAWDVERVWHFLAGLFPRFREPLLTAEGAPLRYGAVLGHDREAHNHPPGTVTRAARGYSLYCRGGRVHLAGGA